MKQLIPLAAAVILAFGSAAQTVENTFTYTQITALTESHVVGQDWQHVISDNGNKVAWYRQSNPKQVYVANADGSGQQSIVDMGTDRLSQVDISADGTKVVYVGGPFAAGHIANFINADGSGDVQLFALNELRMHTLKIAGDGSKAFFNIYTNANIASGGGPIERGVYSINLDGTGLTQVVGPADVAAVLGVSASDIGTFYGGSNGPSIDVSYDGTEVVFMARNDVNNRHYVFTTNNGTTEILGPFLWVGAVGISPDGTKVAATINSSDGNREGWVANYDGTGLQMIASNDDMFYFTNGNSQGDAISLTSNGSKVLFDSYPYLFNTDGSGHMNLMAGTIGGAGFPMLLDGMERPTMTSDGSRVLFSFRNHPLGAFYQLTVLDINPPTLGVCPTLSNFFWNPNGAAPGGQSSELRVTVTPALGTDSVWYAGNVALLDDVKDGTVFTATFSDDGTSAGDQVAGDGVYTHNNVYAYSNAELGPRTMRYQSEVFAQDLKLKATAVDVNTWYVADDVGIEDLDEDHLLLYPNPTNGLVYFNLSSSKFNDLRLEVYDQLGRQIEVHPFIRNQQPMINPGTWADGIYTVSLINDEGGRVNQKLVVK